MDEKYSSRFDWEYCECGCHGNELRIGNFYRWSLTDFPNSPREYETQFHHLNDGHKWGQHLGTFRSWKDLEDFVAKDLEKELESLAAAIRKRLV